MEASETKSENFIGLLQEKCVQYKFILPEYTDDIDEDTGKLFKCYCKLGDFITDGTSFSKKLAKQIAAKEMLLKTEQKDFFVSRVIQNNLNTGSAVSQLNEYASKMKMKYPLFSEKPEDESGMFVFSCTFNGFTVEGKGYNKKQAKDESANLVVKHFNIDAYFENLKISKVKKDTIKPPTQQLHEFCQSNNLSVVYSEENVCLSKKKTHYIVTCKVDDLEQKSSPNESKKMAKLEAAELVLNLIKKNRPTPYPSDSSLPKAPQKDVILQPLVDETVEPLVTSDSSLQKEPQKDVILQPLVDETVEPLVKSDSSLQKAPKKDVILQPLVEPLITNGLEPPLKKSRCCVPIAADGGRPTLDPEPLHR